MASDSKPMSPVEALSMIIEVNLKCTSSSHLKASTGGRATHKENIISQEVKVMDFSDLTAHEANSDVIEILFRYKKND